MTQTPEPAQSADTAEDTALASPTVIRTAGPADRVEIMRLLREIVEFHGVPAPPEAELDRSFERIFENPDHQFLVAETDSRLDAMCALLFFESTWSAAPVCELQDVVVSARARGQGRGSALLHTAFSIARSRGCARVYLTAEAWNFDAHTFYRSVGFEEKTCLYFEKSLSGDGDP